MLRGASIFRLERSAAINKEVIRKIKNLKEDKNKMKRIIFLILAAAFCLNCGTKTATNTATVNKTNTTTAAGSASPTSAPPTNTSAPSDTSGASNEELDFTLVNKTGYNIKKVSIGATGTGEWTAADEVLKGRNFADGDALEIKFNPKAKARFWDIKVEWADGSGGEEWLKLNLTEIEKATLVYDKEKDETSAIIE